MSMMTIAELMTKLAATGVRPLHVAATGSADVEQINQMAHYGYVLESPCSVGDGTFCTAGEPGSPRICLFADMARAVRPR